MNRVLTPLQSCSDLYAVKTRLQSVCERFGTALRLDVLAADQAGQRRALCFVRMSSPEEEQRVKGALGVGRFGGDLVVLVELAPLQGEPGVEGSAMNRAGPQPSSEAARH